MDRIGFIFFAEHDHAEPFLFVELHGDARLVIHEVHNVRHRPNMLAFGPMENVANDHAREPEQQQSRRDQMHQQAGPLDRQPRPACHDGGFGRRSRRQNRWGRRAVRRFGRRRRLQGGEVEAAADRQRHRHDEPLAAVRRDFHARLQDLTFFVRNRRNHQRDGGGAAVEPGTADFEPGLVGLGVCVDRPPLFRLQLQDVPDFLAHFTVESDDPFVDFYMRRLGESQGIEELLNRGGAFRHRPLHGVGPAVFLIPAGDDAAFEQFRHLSGARPAPARRLRFLGDLPRLSRPGQGSLRERLYRHFGPHDHQSDAAVGLDHQPAFERLDAGP